MSFEEIEEAYRKNNEEIARRFKEEFSKKTHKELEQVFKEESRKARDQYFVQFKRQLEKENFLPKEKKKRKEVKIRPFEAQGLSLESGFFERLKINVKIKSFRMKMKMKNSFDRVYYPHISYIIISIKFKLKKFWKFISFHTELLTGNVMDSIKFTAETIKKIAKLSAGKSFDIFKKLTEKLKKKKKDPEKKEAEGTN